MKKKPATQHNSIRRDFLTITIPQDIRRWLDHQQRQRPGTSLGYIVREAIREQFGHMKF